jgi:hypothetical protein
MENPQRTLRVVESKGIENLVNAPPILMASSHTIDFFCGNCGAVLRVMTLREGHTGRRTIPR